MRLNMNNNGSDGQGALEQILNTTEQQLQLPHRKNSSTRKQSCACITGSSYTSRVIGQQLQVPEKFRKREQTAYLKYYNNAPNNISNANISNNSLTTTSKSCFSFCKTTTPHLPPPPATAASPTTGVALNSNLVHRAIASLVWHITASTAISIFATLFYLMANTQGASAVLAITAIASSASSSSSSTSLEHLGFYLNINHTTTTPANNSSTIKSSEFLNFHPNVNATEISILNYVSSSSPAKYNNNNNNINNNTTITLTNNKVISVNESLDDLSAEDASEYIFDRTDVRIIFITLYTMVFCCCFFGNLLVILVVTLSRRLRSITNFFLANLALADFCVGLFCVMQNLSIYLIDSWVFGEFLCRMYQFVHSLSYTASIFILVVICMERYFAIVHPITCKQILTAARLRMVILTVWITSAVYSTPKFVFSKTIKNVHTESGREEEICVLDRKMFNSKLLDMINFGLLYCIPLLVMTVLYSKIAVALWRSSRGLQHHLNQQENSMTLHNSMYHHQHQQQQQQQQNNHNHNNHQQQQLQHQQPTANLPTPLATPISVNKSIASSSTLSHKPSCKYEKRDISTTDSQVTLDADRPVVSTCRKTSFYQHSHHSNHLTHQQPTAMSANHRSASQTAAHHGPGLHGSQRVSHISHSSNNVLRARRGVVRMLIIFVLTFALCNLPYHARKMWQYWSRSYRGDSNFNALLTPLTFLVTYFNSGINPLLYAFLSRNFRKGMRELLMCSWRKSKTKSSTNSSMHHKRHTTLQHSMPTDTTHIGNEQL